MSGKTNDKMNGKKSDDDMWWNEKGVVLYVV